MLIRGALALALAFMVQGCSIRFAGERDADWARDAADAKAAPAEQSVVLPAYPQDADLFEFRVGATGSHRYFVDTRTLDVGADDVVRYALVVKTAGGASNASYEGIRCSSYEKRIYALGHPQRKWIEARRSVWEPIPRDRANAHHAVLYAEYFCPDRRIVADRAAVLRGFASGGYGNRVR
jgi:CNP1-like family